ncbi:MAG TPA: transcriptional regulator NrdR [Candidatus Nanoarchaeia archaeon]|nr:transcriptional regulator NrdR [Candidatus Nanoarchaeia archaeon]
MKCPYCSFSETKVIDSRESLDLNSTRRRRECLKCEKRFTTYEKVESAVFVVKKDGSREQFDRNKVRRGMQKACEKRPISSELIEIAVSQIESQLRSLDTAEIESRVIGDLVMEKLKSLDKVAYIRFASVYREFKDISTFEREIRKIA